MNVYQINSDGVFLGVTIAEQDPLDTNNWLIPALCVETEPPSYTEGQLVRWEGSSWSIEDIPVEEEESKPEPLSEDRVKELKAYEQREDYLLSSDWTQLPDSSADKLLWGKYRQALRDITQQEGWPLDVDWPTKPE